MTTVVLPQGFDADCSDEDMVSLFSILRGRKTNLKGSPLTPRRFNKKLLQLQEVAERKGVRLFTNGLEDMELVRRKYADSYNLLTRATTLYYGGRHWSSDDFECLAEALPDFTDPNFGIRGLHAQHGSGPTLGSGPLALSGRASETYVGLSLRGQHALFRAMACEAVRLVLR